MNKYIEKANIIAESFIVDERIITVDGYRSIRLTLEIGYCVYRPRRRYVSIRVAEYPIPKLLAIGKEMLVKEIFAELRIKRRLDKVKLAGLTQY